MKKLKIMVAAALAVALAGCVSVESLRTQLSSSNPQDVQKAEKDILCIVSTGKDSSGFMNFTTEQQLEYVNLATSNSFLLKIVEESHKDDIIAAAASKIDLSKPGIGAEILLRHKGTIDKVDRAVRNIEEAASRERQRYASRGISVSQGTGSQRSVPFSDKVIATLCEKELLQAIGELGWSESGLRGRMSRRLIDITQDVDLLVSFFNGEWRDHVDDNYRAKVVGKLAGMADRLTDAKVIVGVLDSRCGNSLDFAVKDPSLRVKLLARLSDEDAEKYALAQVKRQSVHSWNRENRELNDAVAVANLLKDPRSAEKVVSAILSKIASYQEACKDSWAMDWSKEDTEKANSLVKRFPKLADETIERLICSDGTGWTHIIDTVPVAVAYDVLSGGKAESSDLELALLKRLPKDKVDMKVYGGVRFDASKKAVNAAMSPEMKKAVAEAFEKYVQGILAKAKEAEKETFAYNGFYLGMSFADAKAMFAHHFPDVQFEEGIDGEGDEADYCIHVPGQSNPFCFASKKDGKVYQFNFGKGLLKKWCKYDASTVRDWAKTFAREHKIAMELDFIDRDGEVYTMAGDLSAEPHPVSLHQEIWTYKSGSKDYRLTYFGERKISGYGAVIRELAREKYRYVSADQGTLRAAIDNN